MVASAASEEAGRAVWHEQREAVEALVASATRNWRDLRLGYYRACIDSITFVVEDGDDLADLSFRLTVLLTHPCCFAVRTVRIFAEPEEHPIQAQPLIDVIAEQCPTTLRALTLFSTELDNRFAIGDLRPLYARHSRLRELCLGGRPSTASAPWGLPNLRMLTLMPAGLSRTWLRTVNAEPWPNLSQLEVSYVGAIDHDIEWLRSARMPMRYPELWSLALYGPVDSHFVVEAIAATGLGSQLRQLSLSWGPRVSDAAEAIAEERDDFAALETLVIRRIEEPELEPIQSKLPWLDVVRR